MSRLENALPYTYQLYDSIFDIDPVQWYQVVDVIHDLSMNRELIHLTETSLSNQAKFWNVLIRDSNQQPVACACLCLFQADGVQSCPEIIMCTATAIRKVWPNILKFSVLFCGLPIPSAETHLKIVAHVDPEPILILLNEVMQKLATQQKADLVVLKEFSEDHAANISTALHALNFIRGDVAPTYELHRHFSDFKDYQSALRANYRRQVQKTMNKFMAANLHVQQVEGAAAIENLFTDQVYQLYLNVWRKSAEKLECLPQTFFSQLGYAMPLEARLTLISEGKQVVAFAIGLLHNQVYKNLYCGIDYVLNAKADLYFNLYYHELDYAFIDKATKITLGQTSDEFKSRLGAIAHPRYFFVRAKNPLAQWALKIFHTLLFPAVTLPAKRQVFKN